MRLGWDPAKSARNIQERKLPFDLVADFGWDTALVVEDTRYDYGEERMRAIGLIGDRLFVVVYTDRADARWVISFRKANDREVRLYGRFHKTKTP
ncbi:MAG: BrnT family toxin [Pseudomonadota bacterium]